MESAYHGDIPSHADEDYGGDDHDDEDNPGSLSRSVFLNLQCLGPTCSLALDKMKYCSFSVCHVLVMTIRLTRGFVRRFRWHFDTMGERE